MTSFFSCLAARLAWLNKNRRHAWLTVGILTLAVFFRLYHVTYHDSYTDEAILAFRAIGLIDYDTSPSQTTPWQWWAEVPWWAHLSWHDHPPVFFLLEHLAMRLLGVNLLAVRLPAVAAGLASVWLLILVGNRLRPGAGYFAGALLAVQSYHVWVSRVGLQDGIVILLLLLCIWSLLRAESDSRWWTVWGLVSGLGISTKYTYLIAFAITAFLVLVFRLPVLRERHFWLGLALVVFGSAPVWLYNIFLYRATGHFDFQISAAFGQVVPQWAFRLGRLQTGDLGDRFVNFFLALRQSSSLVFLGVSALALLAAVWFAARFRERARTYAFLLGAVVLMWLWFFVIGATYRFVVMLAPLLVLLIGYVGYELYSRFPRSRGLWLGLAGGFILFEMAFTVNSFLTPVSHGQKNIAYAQINEEAQNFGFNELDAYLTQLLAGKYSAIAGEPAYHFLAREQEKGLARLRVAGAEAYPALIIYDNDINFIANLWLYQRRLVYEGWVLTTADEFVRLTDSEAPGRREEYFRRQGVQEFIFITPASETTRKEPGRRTAAGGTMQTYLQGQSLKPEVIKNRVGETAFLVYRFK